MKKHEILYDWPIAEITRLADSDTAMDYATNLVDPVLGIFVKLTEQMRGLSVDLARAKADRQHFGNWNELKKYLEEFDRQFSTFPNAVFKKFRLFVILADNLAQSTPDLDMVDIDNSLFEIRELTESLPLSWFSYENAMTFTDSIAVFSCADMTSLESDISLLNISPEFLFHFLASLPTLPNLPICHLAFVKKNTPQIETPAVDAFVRLVILSAGKCVHSARHYPNPPSVLNRDHIQAGYGYHQWNDVLNVLSEYNSRNEVLLKYLTIYHVIENFMFKFPIVELERQQAGRMFSIRDFRRLYRQVEETEFNALKRLFTSVFQMNAKTGITFEHHIVARWQSLVPATTTADIEKALLTLDIKKGSGAFQHDDFKVGSDSVGYFTKMVYYIRNAIVHNKETEFHLTYASLDATFSALIESFLIPSLEEISFALIGSPNQELWYSSKELLLYK